MNNFYFVFVKYISLVSTELERGEEVFHFAGSKANSTFKISYWKFCCVWRGAEQKSEMKKTKV